MSLDAMPNGGIIPHLFRTLQWKQCRPGMCHSHRLAVICREECMKEGTHIPVFIAPGEGIKRALKRGPFKGSFINWVRNPPIGCATPQPLLTGNPTETRVEHLQCVRFCGPSPEGPPSLCGSDCLLCVFRSCLDGSCRLLSFLNATPLVLQELRVLPLYLHGLRRVATVWNLLQSLLADHVFSAVLEGSRAILHGVAAHWWVRSNLRCAELGTLFHLMALICLLLTYRPAVSFGPRLVSPWRIYLFCPRFCPLLGPRCAGNFIACPRFRQLLARACCCSVSVCLSLHTFHPSHGG